MKRTLKWVIGLVLGGGVIVGLTFAYLEGRKEMARERERESPVKAPPKVSRGSSGESVITFDAETQKRAGLRIASVAGATQQPEVEGYGKVLDPTPLVTLQGELLTAEAALTNSAAQLQRTRTLFREDESTSRRALDAAEAQFRTDEVRVQVAKSRVGLEWGEAVAGLEAGERSNLVEQLLGHRTALLRVDLPVGEKKLAKPPFTARVAVVGLDDRFHTANFLSVAPAVNSKLQGEAFYFRADGDASLRPGAALLARLPAEGEPQSGVEIPRSAVVRFEGKTWVYVQVAPDKFARREVLATQATDGGWFVRDNVRPGDKVVSEGEQTLLSEELKSQIHVGEEAEKQ